MHGRCGLLPRLLRALGHQPSASAYQLHKLEDDEDSRPSRHDYLLKIGLFECQPALCSGFQSWRFLVLQSGRLVKTANERRQNQRCGKLELLWSQRWRWQRDTRVLAKSDLNPQWIPVNDGKSALGAVSSQEWRLQRVFARSDPLPPRPDPEISASLAAVKLFLPELQVTVQGRRVAALVRWDIWLPVQD